jgi:hypothetical protein
MQFKYVGLFYFEKNDKAITLLHFLLSSKQEAEFLFIDGLI